jgi:serine/threonine-protein kinase HipA
MNIKVEQLIVKYNGITVGFLKELNNSSIAFQYDELWVKEGFSISPISLPLSDEVFISKSKHFSGLFGVFNDSLPDGWGELLSRRMLMTKGINYDHLSALTRLSLIGENGLGALCYEPKQFEEKSIATLDLDKIAEEISKILSAKTDKADIDQLYKLGGASGGARPKAHLLIDKEEWIVKFPSSMDPIGIGIGTLEIEANELAKRSKINVNEYKLFQSNITDGYFGSKRFDRVGSKKVHMISLASILETTHRVPNLDYTHLFQVTSLICHNHEQLYEAYRRMCFNILFQNKDDHGKNMAFIYNESQKSYQLSPFYDITCTKDKFEHEMTVLGYGNPSVDNLLEIAKEFKLSRKRCLEIISQINEVLEKSI